MFFDKNTKPINRTDVWVALGLGILALACYLRTLAPDLLYADSAEFQALSYTLGITHSGYPVYLVLGKVFGTLLPLGTFAYRINLLSAVYAAGTLSGIYLIARLLTSNRIGPVLGGIALGFSLSFWSQAVIAEVYTLATLALVWSIYCLFRWQDDPPRNGGWVLASLLLLGLGVHTMIELVVPAVGILIIWTLAAKHAPFPVWRRSIGMAIAGGAIGAAVFFLTFFLSDTIVNPATSFIHVTLIPSRSLWGASLSDLDGFFKRVYHIAVSLQWSGSLFSGNPNFMKTELFKYLNALTKIDFNPFVLAACGVGLLVALFRKLDPAVFILLAYLTVLFFIVNYQVSNKDVFYLSTYVFIAVLAGVGAGFVLEKVEGILFSRGKQWFVRAGYLIPIVLLAYFFISPGIGSRWQALKAGKATFFTDDEYTYPFSNLAQPRAWATAFLKNVPDNSMVLMDWQQLYATAYIANVEQNKTKILFREASPYPSNDTMPDSLIEDVNQQLKSGRPVYAQRLYKNLMVNYKVKPLNGWAVYQLSLR